MARTFAQLRLFRSWPVLTLSAAIGFVVSFVGAWELQTEQALAAALAVAGALAAFIVAGGWSVTRIIARLVAQNARRDFALNNMAQGLCMFDGQHRLVVWNRQYQAMYKLEPQHIWRGCTLRDLLVARREMGTFPHDPDAYIEALKASLKAGKEVINDIELPDGRFIAVINRPTREGGWVATHEDVTERKRAERELDQTRTFLDTVIENVPSPILVKGYPSLKYLLINGAAEKFLGVSRDSMLGKTAASAMPKASVDMIEAQDRKLIDCLQAVDFEEHTVVTPGNGTRIATTTRLPVMGADGKPQYIINMVHDLTDRRRHEQRIAHMAHHDLLTDLPNRAAFNECLEATIEMAAPLSESFALLSIDLDRFKAVNDVYGHAAGDALLREVARRLEHNCEGAFLARLGGDEFVIISPTGPQPGSAEVLAERLTAAFENDISIDSHSMRVGLTIGVALYPQDGADASSLIANADAALWRAKSEARGSIRFFERSMDAHLRDKRALQQDLRKAIENNELELHYQPQAAMNGEITGFEALARWHHPRRGLVPPSDFISLAEESGIIGALGEWVLRTACQEAASWPKPLHVAVNLSPVQFQHGDLPRLVQKVLEDTGLAAARLELEITEGVLIGDFTGAVAILRRLKKLGARVAMDDFGTGYSSLSYLQSFPFDSIKIDRAFIANLAHGQQSQTIVRAVIALSRGLGVPVVAEGVETLEQLRFLTDEHCSAVQGYLIGRPKPIADYAETVGRKPDRPALALVATG